MARILIEGSTPAGAAAGRCWIEVDDERRIRWRIRATLGSEIQRAARWSVVAYEGLPDFGDHPNFHELLAYLDACDEFGDAFASYWGFGLHKDVLEAANGFADSYQGTYPSLEAWALEYRRLTGKPTEKAGNEVDDFASKAIARGWVRVVANHPCGLHVYWLDHADSP